MTGYGNTVVDFDNKKIHVELKALNSKAFDLNVRIAPLYREREMEIRQILSRELERGKVDFSIWIEKNDQQLAIPINTDVVASYYRQICEVSEKIGLDRPSLSPAEWMPALLRLPDTMTSVEVEVLSDEEWERLIPASDILKKTELYLDDTPGITITEMKSRLRRLHNLDLEVLALPLAWRNWLAWNTTATDWSRR